MHIWNQSDRGCYVHTGVVAKGNGVKHHACWVFSKCHVGRSVFPQMNPLWLYKTQEGIMKNRLVATIPKLGKSYSVSFDVYPTRYQKEWGNIIHLSAHGGDFAKYGDRTPGVWFHPSSTSAKTNRLHICSAISGNRNYCFNSKSFPLKRWLSIKIAQVYSSGKYVYKIYINGGLVHSKVNTKPSDWSNVKVYSGDPWYESQKGYIRNLVVHPVLQPSK